MMRTGFAFGIVLTVATAAASAPAASAQDPQPLPPLPASSSPAPAPGAPVAPPPAAAAPASSAAGVAVVGAPGTIDAAWPLAQAVYADPSLRPGQLDEPRARVLCGEPPASGAPSELRDLAESLAAIRGEDAASRAILADIARRLNVRALVIVRSDGGHPVARVFTADTVAFDAATYTPDAGSALAWSGATQSLARAFGSASAAPAAGPPAPPVYPAPPLATHDEPPAGPPSTSKAFYESGWFWGALSAAAFAGGAVFFATRDNSASTIHLEMQVPH